LECFVLNTSLVVYRYLRFRFSNGFESDWVYITPRDTVRAAPRLSRLPHLTPCIA
jgi:hypothetical protein